MDIRSIRKACADLWGSATAVWRQNSVVSIGQPRPPFYVRFFKGLPLSAHFVWLGILLMILIISWSIPKPDMSDRPLAHSEGQIVWVGYQKRGYEVMLQPESNSQHYERLLILDSRSAVHARDLLRAHQPLRVDRYGDLIANCWTSDQQVCFSRCSSDLQCKEQRESNERQSVSWMVAFSLFGYLFNLIRVACRGQTGTKPDKPRESQ